MDQVDRSDTWELLNDEARHLLDSQRTAAERIETKAALVVGAALTGAQFVSSKSLDSYWLPAANAFYLLGIAAGLVSVRPRRFDNIGVEQLIRGVWWRPRGHAAAEILNNRNLAVKANARRQQSRVTCFWVSLAAVAAGAIMSVGHLTMGSERDVERLNGTCTAAIGGTFVCTARP